MGYQVSRSTKTYRLIYQTKGHPPRNVSKESGEARNAGFTPEMSYEEAKAVQIKLAAREGILREAAAYDRQRKNKRKVAAYLAEYDVEGFAGVRERKKIRDAHWNTMAKLIKQLGHPSQWETSTFWTVFKLLRLSPNYGKKIRNYLNLWGQYLCQKEGKWFTKIGPATPKEVREMRQNASRSSGKSAPLTPELLTAVRELVSVPHYNWLYISLWLGLRPREVDNLLKEDVELWFFEGEELCVFQEKLLERGVPEDRCWKYIPIDQPEQRLAANLIKAREFARPPLRKFRKVLPGCTAYAGRVGFVGLMKSRGWDLFKCRDGMGHLSVKTTEAFYEHRVSRRVAR